MADLTKYTRKEVQEKSCPKENPLVIIHNEVINVSKFLDDHPGGHEVLLKAVGTDASEQFDDIGHSVSAEELKQQFRVGVLVDEDKDSSQKAVSAKKTMRIPPTIVENEDFTDTWKFKVAVVVFLLLVYNYLF